MSNRGPQAPSLDLATQNLCRQVSGMLAMIGAARFNGWVSQSLALCRFASLTLSLALSLVFSRSLASIYAERIDSILQTFDAPPRTYPAEPPCVSLVNADASPFDLAASSPVMGASDFGPDSFLYPSLFTSAQAMPWMAGLAPGV